MLIFFLSISTSILYIWKKKAAKIWQLEDKHLSPLLSLWWGERGKLMGKHYIKNASLKDE